MWFLEGLIELIVQVVFEGLILGTLRLIKRILGFLRSVMLGKKEKPSTEEEGEA